MKTQTARIQVQNNFCARCKSSIKSKLTEISNVSNVELYAKESLVVFNFFKANELSEVLNTLTEIGYPEMGERISDSCGGNQKMCLC